jgi:hypothetical protein
MKISFWHNNVALAGQDIYKTFESTVAKTDQVVHEDMSADVAVIWSVLWHGRMKPNQQIYDYFRSENKPVVIIEVGVLNRNTTWRIAVNHIDNTGYYGHYDHPIIAGRHERFNFEPRKFRAPGSKILICCQNEASQLWRNMPKTDEWLTQTIDRIKIFHPKKEIIIRPHPRYPISRQVREKYNVQDCERRGERDDTDFLEQLEDIFYVVSPTGGSAVEAIINGVPAIVSERSLARPVASIDYAFPLSPNKALRKEWIKKMRNTEWCQDEIEEGEPWRRLRPYVLDQTENRQST